MKKLLLLAIFSTSVLSSTGGGVLLPPKINVLSIKSVYDGDTFRAYVAGYSGDQRIRVKGVDTPEIRGKCESEKKLAIKARDFARQYLKSANKITLTTSKRERDLYGRILAKVNVDGRDLAQTLISKGLGRKWKGKRENWCN